MIESGITKAAKLIENLTSAHRWAITGTPIEKDLNDLCGLLKYLKCDPFNNEEYWKQSYRDSSGLAHDFAQKESRALVDVMRPIMWRTCKTEDILKQVNLPSQTEHTHFIEMNDLEAYFYAFEFNECSSAMRHKIEKLRKNERENIIPKYLGPHAMKVVWLSGAGQGFYGYE